MNQSQAIRPSDRRLFLALAAAALFVVAALVWRLAGGGAAPTMAAPASAASTSSTSTLAPTTTAETVARLRAQVQAAPDDANVNAALGLALLQQVRETADPALYAQAEAALDAALALNSDQLDALVGQGTLALARHDFATALTWGERARALNPYRADALGVLVDGHVELGQYEEAVAAAQAMVNLRPNLASYSRIAYLRELHGDTAGAIEAMIAPAQSGAPGSEATAWTLTQLGNLLFESGDTARAAIAYNDALNTVPGYAYAQAGQARLQAAAGDTAGAIAVYKSVVDRLPVPEFVIALGRLYEATGQTDKATSNMTWCG